MVVAIVPISIPSAVDDTASSVEVDPSATLAEMTKRFAKRGLLRLGAHGVDPELCGARVQIDGDFLPRGTELNVNAVEETVLLALEGDFVLALGHAFYDGCASGNLEGEADKAIFCGSDSVSQRGGREGEEKSGQHLSKSIETFC
jgi:hypothetical protein